MNEKIWYLVGKDTKDKIRIAIIQYEMIDGVYYIHRQSGLLGGKLVEHPDKKVVRGKVKRTITEQVELESLHLVKEKLDKGYREVEKHPALYSREELDEILGIVVTNQLGVPKPMLAKQADKVTKEEIFNNEWFASRKIDGLRAEIYKGTDGKLHTASRGAMNYDAAMFQILNHPDLIRMFDENPGLILDGECYHHGMSLQKLNSIARTQVTAVDFEVLQFYWYDIVDTTSRCSDRLKRIIDLAKEYNLSFKPEKEFTDDELRIQVVPHVKISGWNNIKKLHDEYVSEGWEGVVIRDPNAFYKPNSRSNYMIKVKEYQDGEFTIIGYELGLRGAEDMTFKCVTEDGQEFLAKPWGDKALKEEYIEYFDEYLGKKAVVKYFYLSDTGVPLQPSVKCIRLEADL